MTKSPDVPVNKACNINATGKAVRLIGGMLLIIVTMALVILIMTNQLTGTLGWWLVGLTIISGVLLIYEGWTGWCVLRAMGLPTPL